MVEMVMEKKKNMFADPLSCGSLMRPRRPGCAPERREFLCPAHFELDKLKPGK
jgi:hypothetical protein